MNPDLSVRSRYSLAVSEREPELCCAVYYDQRYLSVIPKECLAIVALGAVLGGSTLGEALLRLARSDAGAMWKRDLPGLR